MFLGSQDRTGTVEAGKRAELLMLDASPVQDISSSTRIAGVMIGGRWFSRADLERVLSTGSLPFENYP